MTQNPSGPTKKNSLGLRFLFWLDEKAYKKGNERNETLWKLSTFLWAQRSKIKALKSRR